jgi:enoyl-CoA hydratase
VTDAPVLVATSGRVRTITLHRPEARNAINAALNAALAAAFRAAEADDGIDVVILTGADPAFCAGLDLKELAAGGFGQVSPRGDDNWYAAECALTKPLVGAVNGVAVTGGLELALACDFLVASERASFADTHGRVGALPGGGLTARLPDAVGLRKAKEMTFTGDFVDAPTARAIGLVNHVVSHDELMPFVAAVAERITSNDQRLVCKMKENYDRGWATTWGETLATEAADFRTWRLDPEDVARRRASVMDRGRSQTATPRRPRA